MSEQPNEQPYTGPDDPRVSALRIEEFAFPGPLRDQLVAAVLSGAKTSTTGLVADYEHENEPLPQAGVRSAVIDSAGTVVAVTETTEVRVVPLAEVDLQHALDEGEGYTTVAEWREVHEGFWHGPQMRAALGDPEFTVHDGTPVVLERFRLVADLRREPAGDPR
ncbi:ASCH domain-containing protein [Kitasatospora sp. A2-31]|uniref:ASCH domain-containing protein n=1 Tax=Kitasatospora sp. A2-31 TaxID=2916414 RepID=UPI001EE855AC|nr:ASCH domain-containing protein [Kitasatospora sp. A2-31]MCG6493025.1 ASCH domain-containing protein [Kitasatospora sp. A2-31]